MHVNLFPLKKQLLLTLVFIHLYLFAFPDVGINSSMHIKKVMWLCVLDQHNSRPFLLHRIWNIVLVILKCLSRCYGVDETWDERIHLQGFIIKHGQNTGRVSTRQTGMAGAKHRAVRRTSVGRRSAYSIQGARQRDNPRERAIIQTRYNQSPKGKAEGISKDTGNQTRNKETLGMQTELTILGRVW